MENSYFLIPIRHRKIFKSQIYSIPCNDRSTWKSAKTSARGLFLFGSLLLISSCVSVPKSQFDAFSNAVDSVQGASSALFDQLNAAEKAQVRTSLDQNGAAYVFDPGQAPYFTSIPTDAPKTAELRAGILVLSAYSQMLSRIVQGQDTQPVIANLKNAVATIQVAADVSGLSAGFAALTPLLKRALEIRSQEQAKTLVLNSQKQVEELVSALKQASPAMYKLLLYGKLQANKAADVRKTSDDVREVISDYVVLVDRLGARYEDLVNAYRSPQPTDLLALTASAGSLASDAAALKQALGKL